MEKLDWEILRDIGAVARSIHSISDIQFRQLQLQKGQFIFLTRICECPGINLIELSQVLRVDKTTTTKAIQKLIKTAYVRKERDATDQRIWRLFPTERALHSYSVVIAAENQYIAHCFAGFSETEKMTVSSLLARMRDNISREWKRTKKIPPATGGKNMSIIEIKEYADDNQEDLIRMILAIQQQEYAIPITREAQPDLANIPGFYQQGNGNFWVALNGAEVVGTIGLIDIGNQQVALRKMFVKASFRGAEFGVAKKLLDQVFDWVRKQNVKTVYLGTTDKFLAAHRFYDKNGFVRIAREELPPNFPVMQVDTVFYQYCVA